MAGGDSGLIYLIFRATFSGRIKTGWNCSDCGFGGYQLSRRYCRGRRAKCFHTGEGRRSAGDNRLCFFVGSQIGVLAGNYASAFLIGSFGVALIACVLAYDGWVQLSFVAGEIRNPRRNVLLALALGTAVCVAIYLLANIAYLRVLTISQIASSDHGATLAEQVMGAHGGMLVSLIVLISI